MVGGPQVLSDLESALSGIDGGTGEGSAEGSCICRYGATQVQVEELHRRCPDILSRRYGDDRRGEDTLALAGYRDRGDQGGVHTCRRAFTIESPDLLERSVRQLIGDRIGGDIDLGDRVDGPVDVHRTAAVILEITVQCRMQGIADEGRAIDVFGVRSCASPGRTCVRKREAP